MFGLDDIIIVIILGLLVIWFGKDYVLKGYRATKEIKEGMKDIDKEFENKEKKKEKKK